MEGRTKEDRKVQVEALIVRIMKRVKTISHNELVAEVFKHINFPLEVSVIKL